MRIDWGCSVSGIGVYFIYALMFIVGFILSILAVAIGFSSVTGNPINFSIIMPWIWLLIG